MYEISVKTSFSGAHRLDGYDGPCRRVHGHNWDVEVFVQGDQLGADGMLVDFTVVKKALNEIISRMDHRDLNELPEFQSANPTSENICRHIHEQLSKTFNCERFKVSKVKVSETNNSSATYRNNELN